MNTPRVVAIAASLLVAVPAAGRAAAAPDRTLVDRYCVGCHSARAKAPQLMKGYLDGALDADAFDEDGYFRTGDLGRQDRAGNVTIANV